MANYWTDASFIIVLCNEEDVAQALNLHEDLCKENDSFLQMIVENHGGNELWIHSDETIDIDAAAEFTKRVLDKFKLDDIVQIAWSNNCGKPRLDAFGGGLILVSRKQICWHDMNKWETDTTKSMKDKLNES